MKKAFKPDRSTQENIKAKLISSVLILLVAVVMIVSSTYAWFTLSKAPEVSGIQTVITSNGNLEIALYQGSDPGEVKVGDANTYATWGNLVDLGDTAVANYGLDQVTLKPAQLYVTGDMKINDSVPLKTPVYTEDGRIKVLQANTLMAGYDPTNDCFVEGGNGVRVIGTSSDMTPQQKDYEDAMLAAYAALEQVSDKATTALTTGGTQLALAAVSGNMGGSPATTYNLSTIPAMLEALEQANAQVKVIVTSYLDALVAVHLETLPSDTYTKITWTDEILADVFGSGWTLTQQDISETIQIANDDPIAQVYTKYNQVATAITAAKIKVAYYQQTNGKTLEAVPWSETDSTSGESQGVTEILAQSGLLVLNELKINGKAIGTALNSDSEFAGSISGGVTVQLGSQSGAISDLAELVGDLAAFVDLDGVRIGDALLDDIPSRIATTVSGDGAPVVDVASSLQSLQAPAAQNGMVRTVSSSYGYAIDLAFRTNAVNSHLMLQTTPVDRIYSDGNTADTMGQGSTMTFTGDKSISAEQVQSLMEGIRVVFAHGEDILGVGVLDPATYVVDGVSISGSIRLVHFTTPAGSRNTYTLALTPAGNGYSYIEEAEQKLTELVQNEAMVLSVYVYLDGDTLTAADFAAVAEKSVNGALNLQFGSDADLVPMSYSAFAG